MDNLTDKVDTVTQQMGELTSIFIDSMGVIKEMQSQVRGLQMENRRIIERVFGEDDQIFISRNYSELNFNY